MSYSLTKELKSGKWISPLGGREVTADPPPAEPSEVKKTASRVSQLQVLSSKRAACQHGAPALVFEASSAALERLSCACEPIRGRADYNLNLDLSGSRCKELQRMSESRRTQVGT